MEFVVRESEKIKVTAGEKVYMMDRPTIGIQMALQDKLEEAGKAGGSPFPAMVKWATDLGLPEDFVMGLSLGTFRELIEYVTGGVLAKK